MSGHWFRLWLLALTVLVAGCGGSEGSSSADSTSTYNVSQSGAQDFGRFRELIDRGEIPGPNTLDAQGFFGEHKLDYPSCEQTLCLQTYHGQHANLIDGDTATLVQIGLNSNVDPDTLPDRPLHLVIAIDLSGSMAGSYLSAAKNALQSTLQKFGSDDRVSLVGFADAGTTLLEYAPLKAVDGVTFSTTVSTAIESLTAGGGTNLHDGLFRALDLAGRYAAPEQQSYVLVISDGKANQGLTAAAKLQAAVADQAAQGVIVSSVGLGGGFDLPLMRSLAESGGGQFIYLEEGTNLEAVTSYIGAATFYPLAVDATLSFAAATGYRIAAVYGAHAWRGDRTAGRVTLPNLFLAKSADEPLDPAQRRGGGGAIMVVLLPSGAAGSDFGTVSLTWHDPDTGSATDSSRRLTVDGALAPDAGTGQYTDSAAEKGFVVLNLYRAFEMAIEAAAAGDYSTAVTVLDAAEAGTQEWLAMTEDAEISHDLTYLTKLRNLMALNAPEPAPPLSDPPEPWNEYVLRIGA